MLMLRLKQFSFVPLVLLSLILAACGSTSSSSNSSNTHGSSTTPIPTVTASPGLEVGSIPGTLLTVTPAGPVHARHNLVAGYETATIQVLAVYDKTVNNFSYDAPANGSKYDSILFQVTDTDAQGSASTPITNFLLTITLTGSDGNSYMPAIPPSNAIKNCPNIVDQASMNPGQTVKGCVTYNLPAGVMPTRITLSYLTNGVYSQTFQWKVD